MDVGVLKCGGQSFQKLKVRVSKRLRSGFLKGGGQGFQKLKVRVSRRSNICFKTF